MNKTFTKLMGIALTIIMVGTMMPIISFAGDTTLNPTPADSPNYLKVIASDGEINEYFYNDTIIYDGKTYIGLVGAKDISSYSDGRIGANLRPIDGGTDYEGVELPSDSNLYVSTNISDSWSNKSYKEINSNYMSWVPTVMQNHLLKYNYDCGKNLVVDSAGTTLKTIGKITIAGKDEIERHATYLKSVASSYTGTGSGYIVTRSGHGGYGFYRYKLDDGSWEKTNNSYSPNGSVFMQMYVDADMFKSVKVDVATMGDNAKNFFKSNYTTADMLSAKIYTIDELKGIGFSLSADDLKVSSVIFEKTTIEVAIDNTVKLNATVKPDYASNKNIIWSSADNTIATVDQNGVVTGLKEGKVKIKATSVDNSAAFAECEVDVVVIPPDSVELDKDELIIYKGFTETLTATVKPDLAYNKEVTWKSSDDSIATVVDGIVKGIKPGKATITVTTVDGGKTDTCEVTVKDLNVTDVKLDKHNITVYVGDKEELKATVSPDVAEVKAVKWSSDNEAVATVIGGVVEGIGEGTANITVTTIDGGYTDTCVVSVKTKDVTDVKLDQISLDINVRETKTLTATVEPSVALNKNVVWKSSDEEVATVKDGVVTGVKEGNAVITAISAENDTIYATCDVAVHKVAVSSVTLDKTTASGIVGSVIKLTATVNPDNAAVLDIIWTSSDETIATVVNGNVTSVKAGKVTIKATSADDDTIFAECDINIVRGPIDSPNYMKLENGIELLFNEVKTVGDEKYFSFTIAKDYAGTTTTRGLYWYPDSVDPLGNALDSTQYGEYYYQAGDTNSRTETTLDTMEYGLPKGIKDNLILNEWAAGFQYPLNEGGGGIAKSMTYFCVPSLEEIQKHSTYIANMITDNTNTARGDGGPLVAIIRLGKGYDHMVYSLAQDKEVSAGQGLSNFGGSVFPTFYVNAKAFTEAKFDVTTLGTDVKAAILGNISRGEIQKAGYTADELVALGYVADRFSLLEPFPLDPGEQKVEFNFQNNDTITINYPLILAVAYGNKNEVIAIKKHIIDAKLEPTWSGSGKLTVDLPDYPYNMGLFAFKSALEPIPMAKAIVTDELFYNSGDTTENIDLTITPDEGAKTVEFKTIGTINPNTEGVVVITKPGKNFADLATHNAEDVILNMAQVVSNAEGKYSYKFTENTEDMAYKKYNAYIYYGTESAKDTVVYTDSGFVVVVQNDYKVSTLDDFVATYGDLIGIDMNAFNLLTSEQKDKVKSAVSVDGKSVEIIVAELNSKMKSQFIKDAKSSFANDALARFAEKYATELSAIDIDVALASSMNTEQETKIKAAVVIEDNDTPKEIADKINKELAVQVVSKANTVAAIKKAFKDYNKYMNLDLVNWIDKAANKDVVYTVLAGETFDDFDDLKGTYEKTVLINRINNVSGFKTLYDILAEYADVNGKVYGVDINEYKKLEETEFANSLVPEKDGYADWADFETTFNANVITYTPGGSGSGGSGGGGGGGGKAPQIFVEFAPETEQQNTPSTPKYMFADLGEAEWAVTYVEALAKLGHINGKGNNTFCPNDSIKREEVVKILVSALGLDVSATEASFTDVDAGAWYAPYLAAANASGIVNGKPDGSFGIGAEITREELATMIYRATGLLASETDVEFADEAEIADYAKEAVSTLVASGVLNGKGNNLFAPKANATRAEASKIIYLAIIGK